MLGTKLAALHVGEPCEARGLQAFGLHWEVPAHEYLTLDEGVAQGLLEVTEVSASGEVPALRVENKADRAVFLMAGEHLRGGKQNRVLNASILVPAGADLPIPVSCVERGRWAYRGAHFGGSGSSSHSHLRRMMHEQSTVGYRLEGKPTSDQTAVWHEVERKLGETGSHSDTHYLHKAYEDTEVDLRQAEEQLSLPEGACGVAFAYGGRIVGFDLFDRPETLARLWPKLLRAYAIDARVAPDGERVTAEQVQRWLEGAPASRTEVFQSPGLGQDVRFEGDQLLGACLQVEDSPVHVEVFSR